MVLFESKVVFVFPFVIPAAFSALTSFSALGWTSVKPDGGAFSISSPSAFTTNTAASTRLIGSCVPNVPSSFPLMPFDTKKSTASL